MARELVIPESNTSEFGKLILWLEQRFPSGEIANIRSEFLKRMNYQTVTLSEELADLIMLPERTNYTESFHQYELLRKAAPDCNHVGFVSWTCCDTHMVLNYTNMLMWAIAYAYGIKSEGQPLSQMWWEDFEASNHAVD